MAPPASDAIESERRAHPRVAAREGVRLVASSGGRRIDATVVDRSLRGMRIELADADRLQGEVMVVSLAASSVHLAKVVWRAPPYAGLSVIRSLDMRAPPTLDDAALRRAWRGAMED